MSVLVALFARARHGEAVLHDWAVQLEAMGAQSPGRSLHDGDAGTPGAGEQSSAASPAPTEPLDVDADDVPDDDEGDAPPFELLEHAASAAHAKHPTVAPRRAKRVATGAAPWTVMATSLQRRDRSTHTLRSGVRASLALAASERLPVLRSAFCVTSRA
jgi:hypothetical protein